MTVSTMPTPITGVTAPPVAADTDTGPARTDPVAP
jgi:hypothetical protein